MRRHSVRREIRLSCSSVTAIVVRRINDDSRKEGSEEGHDLSLEEANEKGQGGGYCAGSVLFHSPKS